MGLNVSIKGLDDEHTYNCGYLTFAAYRQKVACAYNEEFGELYEKPSKYFLFEGYTDEELKRWNEICNDDLDIFLEHSDCEGKFTPQECKKIYNAMKDLKVEMQGHNYGIMKPYDMHQQWLNMFKHCYQKRINMYFG
jgi:hypothetical protein